MITDPLTAIATITVVAVGCQWLAARLRVPSVLPLLAAGVALNTFIDPDQLFGDLLFTLIGLGVAILLFEGGTSLRLRDLQAGKAPVLRLVTIGALLTWIIGTLSALAVLDITLDIAILIGAILTVSGPTVVGPMLSVARPREPVGSVMRWEGILIDPIGAALAIVVLDAVIEDPSPTGIALGVVGTFAAGLVVGLATSAIILAALRNRLLADHLQAPATLAAVIGAYAVANELRPEAGLVAATVLGMAFANQRDAPAAHIVDFNQYLGVSVLGVLFVVLGARVELDQVVDTALAAFALLALLVVVARPIAVTASTVGTKLQWRERAFLMAMAPRGVVAAAVASLFAIELAGHDIEPGPLVPVVFSVVVGTVLIAGLSARLAARRLRVAQPDPKGVALIGGGPFAVDFADRLSDLGIPTLHVGLEEEDADLAAGRGQLVFRGRLDSEEFPATVDDLGIAHAVALSGNDHLDGFATDRIASVIGSGNLYGLHNPAVEPGSGADRTVKPQAVLPAHLTADRLHQLFETGVGLRHQLGESHAGSDGDEIWLTICRVDAHLNITFDSDPGVAGETDTLIQLGPIGPIEPGAA